MVANTPTWTRTNNMSLHLEFEPHSWYKGAAIQKQTQAGVNYKWLAFVEDGVNSYSVITLAGHTLAGLKEQITEYHKRNAERDACNRAQIGE